MDAARILVVEDDHDIANPVALHLYRVGCEVDLVDDGDSGLEQTALGDDLIVLDVALPKLSGTEFCQRVLGPELDADDYLVKPFSFRELQARVKALLRRSPQSGQAARINSALTNSTLTNNATEVGALVIDTENRSAVFEERLLQLTFREFDLLVQFARVCTHTQLLDLVWGYGYGGLEGTVTSHINRLRGKLERTPASPAYIQTVWGVGTASRQLRPR